MGWCRPSPLFWQISRHESLSCINSVPASQLALGNLPGAADTVSTFYCNVAKLQHLVPSLISNLLLLHLRIACSTVRHLDYNMSIQIAEIERFCNWSLGMCDLEG